jgi:hypothetical protein
VIGIGPHEMSGANWLFVALLQIGLIVLAALSLWLAVHITRGSGR